MALRGIFRSFYIASIFSPATILFVSGLSPLLVFAEGLREISRSSTQFEDMSDSSLRDFKTILSLENQQYQVHLPEQPDLDNAQLVSLRVYGSTKVNQDSWLRLGVNTVLSSQMSKNTTVFGLNEFYLQLPFQLSNTQSDLTVGRRLMNWSDTDRRWSLGVFESKLYTDALRTESQGLTGIFVKTSGPKGNAIVFGTGITIPSQGPDIQEEGGTISADSRWYQTPTKDFQFQNSKKKIDYRIDIRDRLALANHGGAGAKLGLGDEGHGAWISGSYAYKAMNELLLQRQNYLQTNPAADVQVTVMPVVGYHSVYAANAGFTRPRWNFSVGYLSDNPVEKEAEKDWIIQRALPFTATSIHLGVSLDQWIREAQLALDYLQISNGRVVDIDSKGEPDDLTFMERRFPFYQPLRLQFQSRIHSWKSQFIGFATSYLYDFEQEGSMVRLQLSYHQSRYLIWTMGADALGVNNSEKENPSTGFLNRYRSNDRAYAGMAYVF